jgi:phosphoribosylpyrophosphate synthetase
VNLYPYGERDDKPEREAKGSGEKAADVYDSIDARMAAKLLRGMFLDTKYLQVHVLGLDLHSPETIAHYYKSPLQIHNVPVSVPFVNFVKSHTEYSDLFVPGQAAAWGPDQGSEDRANWIAHCLGIDGRHAIKRRERADKTELVSLGDEDYDLKGKTVLVADDILGTFSSGRDVSLAIMDKGAAAVYLLMSKIEGTKLEELDDRHQEGAFKAIFHPNIVPLNRDYGIPFPVDDYVGQIIMCINQEQDFADLLNPMPPKSS